MKIEKEKNNSDINDTSIHNNFLHQKNSQTKRAFNILWDHDEQANNGIKNNY